MSDQLEYNVNTLTIADAEHVKRVLNMAAEDGWEVVTVLAIPEPKDTTNTGLVVWRRKISK